jgi:hypothetical protein
MNRAKYYHYYRYYRWLMSKGRFTDRADYYDLFKISVIKRYDCDNLSMRAMMINPFIGPYRKDIHRDYPIFNKGNGIW